MYKTMAPRYLFIILALLTTAFLAIPISADVPQVISYQGRITDSEGVVVPNGEYDIVFRIYDDSTSGAVLWIETHSNVSVQGGLFSVYLGATEPCDASIYEGQDRFMSIEIEGDGESSPRTRMVTVPYAFHSQIAETVSSEEWLNATGDTLDGVLYLCEGGVGGSVNASNIFSFVQLAANGQSQVEVTAFLYGSVVLKDNDGDQTVNLNAGLGSGGHLYLDNATGDERVELSGKAHGGYLSLMGEEASAVILDAHGVGDASVVFPNDAVNSDVMLDEPGCATVGSVLPMLVTSGVTELLDMTIDLPAASYVYVIGKCYGRVSGTLGSAIVAVDVRLAPSSGGILMNNATVFGLDEYPNTGPHYFPVFTAQLMYLQAGTHELLLEAMPYGTPGSGAELLIESRFLTALSFPTSVGGTYSYVSEDDASEFESRTAEAVPYLDASGSSGTRTMYKVDLRELEMKAKRARLREKEAQIQALKAELELRRAQEQATLSQTQQME